MRLLKNKTAMMGVIIALVITLVALGVVLSVGLMIVGNLNTTIGAMDLGTSGNSTRTTLFQNIYSAFDLSVIVPIIAGAALVIGAIVAGFSLRARD